MAKLPPLNEVVAFIAPEGERIAWRATPAHHAACVRYLREPLARMARIGALTWSDLHCILLGEYSGIGPMAAREVCLQLLVGAGG